MLSVRLSMSCHEKPHLMQGRCGKLAYICRQDAGSSGALFKKHIYVWAACAVNWVCDSWCNPAHAGSPFAQLRERRVTDVNALVHIATKHPFESLGQEAALDNEAQLTIQVATGAQLCQEKRLHMLALPVHGLTELRKVGENCLLRALTRNLQPLHNCGNFFHSSIGHCA